MAVIWGVNFPVVKLALESVPPLAFNALRFPLAGLVLLFLVRSRRSADQEVLLPRRRDWVRLVALGIWGNVFYQYLFIYGVEGTSAGNASLLLSTTPVWAALLSTAARHETLSAGVWQGILLALVGMVLVVSGGAGFSFGLETLRGDLLMVAAAVTWASFTVGSSPMIQRYGPMRVTAWTLWIAIPILVAVGLPQLSVTPVGELGAREWFAVVYAGVGAIGMAYALWNRGVRRVGTSRTAIYGNAVPVVALLAAWVTLGEAPTALQVAGAAVILGGLTLSRRVSRGGQRRVG
jgi:drug/metabolite transporter (DMT)-like permease